MTLRAARFLQFSLDFENFIRQCTVSDRKLYGKCGLNWEAEASTVFIRLTVMSHTGWIHKVAVK